MAAGFRRAMAGAGLARCAAGGGCRRRRVAAGLLAPGCARTLLTVMAACAACVGLAACGSGHPAGASPTWEVRAGQVRGLGTIVTDGRGFTLYIYQPDRRGPSVCTGVCAVQWPPLVLPRGVRRPVAGPGVNPACWAPSRGRAACCRSPTTGGRCTCGRATSRPGRPPARPRTWARGTRCRSAGASTGCRCPDRPPTLNRLVITSSSCSRGAGVRPPAGRIKLLEHWAWPHANPSCLKWRKDAQPIEAG